MKSIAVFACGLLISASAVFYADGHNNEKRNKEIAAVERAEEVKNVELTGTVMDDNNKEMLAGAAILIDGKKYYSDLDGQFAISGIKHGKHELKVELISYETYQAEVEVNNDERLQINLSQK